MANVIYPSFVDRDAAQVGERRLPRLAYVAVGVGKRAVEVEEPQPFHLRSPSSAARIVSMTCSGLSASSSMLRNSVA